MFNLKINYNFNILNNLKISKKKEEIDDFVTRRKIFISHKLFSLTILNKKHSVSHNFFEDEAFSQITFERKVTLKN